MDTRHAFARAFREIRKSRSLTQEDFAVVSSRTYVSTLERGMKSPTLEKLDLLAQGLGIHPMTLLTLTFMHVGGDTDPDRLLSVVRRELNSCVAPNQS